MKTKALLVLTVCAVLDLGGAAHAAEPPDTYAVVALVGDELTLIRYQPSTGSAFNKNLVQKVSTQDHHFDQFATRVALNMIHRTLPEAMLQGVELPDGTVFGDADKLLAQDGGLPTLLSTVKPLLKSADTHYLVVLSKYRDDAHLKTANGSTGSGKLSGLGFYVDSYLRMNSSATGEQGRGFLAPYAYMQVSLVDLRTGAVVRSRNASETMTRANVGSDTSLDPWTALSAEEKIRLLDLMIGQGLQRIVPQVVAPA
jgi:hypothetical protein